MAMSSPDQAKRALLAVAGQCDPSGRWFPFWPRTFPLAGESMSLKDGRELQSRLTMTVRGLERILEPGCEVHLARFAYYSAHHRTE